jgi:MSHA biogenesis protein MshE
VLAQRLVRRICTDCAESYAAGEHEIAWLCAQVGATVAARMAFQHGAGCGYCNMTGYRGRIAVYELLEIDREQADAIRRNDLVEFARISRARRDYRPLALSAIELAGRGLTTLAEAMRSVSGISEEMAAPAATTTKDADIELELRAERVLSQAS